MSENAPFWPIAYPPYLGLFQKLSSGGGGGLQALFCPVGGGCFVDVPEGWGDLSDQSCPGGGG